MEVVNSLTQKHCPQQLQDRGEGEEVKGYAQGHRRFVCEDSHTLSESVPKYKNITNRLKMLYLIYTD